MNSKRLSELRYKGLITDGEYKELNLAIKALEERPQGEWINGDDKCNCCGKSKFEDLDADIWADWQPNYCPNCGADMRVKDELNRVKDELGGRE